MKKSQWFLFAIVLFLFGFFFQGLSKQAYDLRDYEGKLIGEHDNAQVLSTIYGLEGSIKEDIAYIIWVMAFIFFTCGWIEDNQKK